MTNRLMIIKNADLLEGNVDFKDKEWTVLRLKNPKDGAFTSYLFMENAGKPGSYDCYEIIQSNGNDSGSLFIDDYVQSDCQILLSHPFDLRYFFISLLMKASEIEEDFKSIGELKTKLCDSLEIGTVKKGPDYEKAVHVIKNLRVDLSRLGKIFDLEDSDKKESSKDVDAVKIQLNSQKCIEWLRIKSEKLCKYLEESAPKQVNAVKGQPDKSGQKHKMEAFELQSQYINRYLAGRLRKELELNLPLDSNENNSKRTKLQAAN